MPLAGRDGRATAALEMMFRGRCSVGFDVPTGLGEIWTFKAG